MLHTHQQKQKEENILASSYAISDTPNYKFTVMRVMQNAYANQCSDANYTPVKLIKRGAISTKPTYRP